MRTAKLSLINVAVISMVCLAAVSLMTISRNASYDTTAVFEAEELIVSPSVVKTAVKPIAPSIKTVAAPVENVIPAPLPVISPRVITRMLPIYPSAALEKGIEGTVVLAVMVSASGRPEKIAVSSSSGDADLDKSALTAVSSWTFEPARRGVEAISSLFEIPVTFRIK